MALVVHADIKMVVADHDVGLTVPGPPGQTLQGCRVEVVVGIAPIEASAFARRIIRPASNVIGNHHFYVGVDD